MSRTASLVTALVVVFLSGRSHAQIPEASILSALQGPEGRQWISIPGEKAHRYYARPGSYRVRGNTLIFRGKLTHFLRNDKDGQIEYQVVRTGNEPPRVTITRVKRGGQFARLVNPVIELLREAPAPNDPRIKIPLEIAKKAATRIRLDHGDWKAAGLYLAEEIAHRVSADQARRHIGRHGLGVTVYEHALRTGRKATFLVLRDIPNFKPRGMNDNVSSLVANVPDGYRLTLYTDANYQGQVLVLGPGLHLYQNLSYGLSGINDKLSSLKWTRVTAEQQITEGIVTGLFGGR